MTRVQLGSKPYLGRELQGVNTTFVKILLLSLMVLVLVNEGMKNRVVLKDLVEWESTHGRRQRGCHAMVISSVISQSLSFFSFLFWPDVQPIFLNMACK